MNEDSRPVQSLDETDYQMLHLLQQEGRLSNVELAKRLHLSPPATHARWKRLEREGYIEGYSAHINAR
ncbi:MAG: winged helix-turn-helix transcriptional regulator, partial [Deltaproteobacteria bacterium]